MRRLRENTSLETDISKTGEVVVEGHAIGRLDGFVFTPDASAAGSEARTLAGAAQKALAGEIDARATRLARASDEQFVLASDGAIRWLGQAVGKLVAAEEVLKPRVRIIADEHLTGAPRDAVQARLDLWLKTHIEKVLAPLFQLAAAEDVTGMARGIAFQLIEALGVLERQRVAEDVKGLDQPARAGLRKYGVRFGAYHLYVPALLKPTPRALATQLYALKHGGRRIPRGSTRSSSLPRAGARRLPPTRRSTGRSIAIAGYRVCGERAVRVDILERLADIIRPALAWRPGAPGVKPPGALDGSGFTVVTGDDVARRLRGRGLRLDPARARLSHGAAAEAGRSAAGRSRRPKRRRDRSKRRSGRGLDRAGGGSASSGRGRESQRRPCRRLMLRPSTERGRAALVSRRANQKRLPPEAAAAPLPPDGNRSPPNSRSDSRGRICRRGNAAADRTRARRGGRSGRSTEAAAEMAAAGEAAAARNRK